MPTGRRARSVAFLVAGAATLVSAWCSYRVTFTAFLFLVPVVVALFVVSIGASWRLVVGPRADRWKNVAVLAACVCSCFVGRSGGFLVRDADFRMRRLPRYEAFVKRIEKSEIPVTNEGFARLELPQEDADLAYGVFASRDEDGMLRVTFLWGAGFPATRYLCYFYRASGTWGPDESRPARRLNEKWFEGFE